MYLNLLLVLYSTCSIHIQSASPENIFVSKVQSLSEKEKKYRFDIAYKKMVLFIQLFRTNLNIYSTKTYLQCTFWSFTMFHSLLFPRVRNNTQTSAATDIYDVGNHYLLQVDAVGFQKEDIQLSATANALKIEANKENDVPEGYSPLYNSHKAEQRILRSFRFRDAIDTENVEAHMTNGLLHVKIPKRSARKIDIQVL